MSNEHTIFLPRFAAIFFSERVHCRFCPYLVANKSGLRFVGVGREDDGPICLTCDYQCPQCGQSSRFFDRNNQFTCYRWWDEFVERNYATPAPEHQSLAEDHFWRSLPKIGPMRLAGDPFGPVQIRGGYKGDVGPVILLYDGIEDAAVQGFMRLERGRRVTLLESTDPLSLPWTKTVTFAKAADGDRIDFDGRNWTKMSVTEIEDITLGFTFEVQVPVTELRVTTPTPKNRSGHGSTHAKKGRKRTRHSSHDPRSLDS